MIRTFSALALLTGCAWNPREFARPDVGRAVAPSAGHISVVTMNTWRFIGPQRVPRLYEALSAVGADLGVTDGADMLPDAIAFEELEDPAAISALRARIEDTHEFHDCVCARTWGGRNRSVIALAVRRSRFTVSDVQCVPLGMLVFDHARCAMTASVRPRDADVALTLAVTHLSPLPWNASQARRLRDALRERRTLESPRVLVTGDFNFGPASAGYRVMDASPLRDAFDRNRGRTHWFGGRIDHMFVTEGLTLVRPLDRSVAYHVVRPSSALSIGSRCENSDQSQCPVSDHLPEGAVFRY